MATTYPGTIQTFTDPSGTSPLAAGPDHAQLHTNINDTLEAVQTVLGTTAGTAVLKNLTAGQFAMPNPMTTQGDIIYGGASGAPTRLAKGTASQVLAMNSGATAPEWVTATAASSDGWTAANETWTYASDSTITVPTGAASRYQKGDRLKFTQTTVKYAVVVTVADTLLTIAVNTDYTVANAAITANYYSHQANPVGYPQFFNWTPSYTSGGGAFTNAPTTNLARFSVIGNVCFVQLFFTYNATSGGSGATIVTGVPINPTSQYVPFHLYNASDGKTGAGGMATNGGLNMYRYDAATFIANSHVINAEGFYQF